MTAKAKPKLPAPPPPPPPPSPISDAVAAVNARDLVPTGPPRAPTWRNYKDQNKGDEAAKILVKSVGKSANDTTDGRRSGWMTRAGILSDFILAGKFEEAATLAESFKRRQDAADEPQTEPPPKRGRNNSSSSSNDNGGGGGGGNDDRGWSRGWGSGWSRGGGSRDKWRGGGGWNSR